MYFSSMTLLFLFLAYEFSKHGTMLLIATSRSLCALMQFLDFILIDRRVLNPDSHRYVVANRMSKPNAVETLRQMLFAP